MLVRIHPTEIHRFWGLFRRGIEASLPPTASEEKMANVLNALLAGKMDVYYLRKNGEALAFVIVDELWDGDSQERNLLIYCLHSFPETRSPTREEWKAGFEDLRAIAKKRHCSGICAYTRKDSVVNLSEYLGAETDWRFLKFSLNGQAKERTDDEG